MSTSSVALNTGRQATINVDRSKIFVYENRFLNGNYNNSSYTDLVLPAGTLMGRVAATGLLVPLASAASDGSQYPVGVLADDYTILAGTTSVVSICIYGDVVSDKVLLQGSDTLTTIISGRQLRDRIAGDTVGIRLIVSTELTGFDN